MTLSSGGPAAPAGPCPFLLQTAPLPVPLVAACEHTTLLGQPACRESSQQNYGQGKKSESIELLMETQSDTVPKETPTQRSGELRGHSDESHPSAESGLSPQATVSFLYCVLHDMTFYYLETPRPSPPKAESRSLA